MNNKSLMNSKGNDRFKVKRKVRVNSLEAAICNVALFKSMKDKQFRDTIYISYSEDGVILESLSEAEWKRAHDHITNFITNKKIALLADNYEKEAYEELISRGLKDITRKIKERNEECPYINIIHYQKLRKSCEYMDKEHYVQPLKDWERKSKKNPNFAFLIVEPKYKFEEVKRALLEHLTGEDVPLRRETLDPLYFLYLCCYSPLKDKIQQSYNRKLIQMQVEGQNIVATNYTHQNMYQYSYTLLDDKSNLSKSGMEFLTCLDLRQQIKNTKQFCKDNPAQVLERSLAKAQNAYGNNFMMVAYRSDEVGKYKAAINKYANSTFSKDQINRKIQMNVVFQFDDIQFLDEVHCSKQCVSWKACINSCPFLIQEYSAKKLDMESFILYLDQLQTYYCTYMVRFYGIALKHRLVEVKDKRDRGREIESYLLIFDYHRSSLHYLQSNDMILDSMQIATISLHVLYLINFLHTHEQPRCLGTLNHHFLFWPMALILPYMGDGNEKEGICVENDVKSIGELMKELLGEEIDEDLEDLINRMTNINKHERISVKKSISQLEDLLCL